jgi:hypothetical protein
MITASELAGFFAAHTVWTLSEADTFDPIVAFTTEDGKRQMMRLVGLETPAAVEFGRKQIAENPEITGDAVLLFDGRITGDDGKLDAIIIEMCCHAFPSARAVVAVPYTPHRPGPFRVHRPKVLRWENCDDFDLDAAFGAFFEGVAAHEQGSEIWKDALDESK